MSFCRTKKTCWATSCKKDWATHHLCREHYQKIRRILSWKHVDEYVNILAYWRERDGAEKARTSELRELPVDLLLKEVGYK